MDRRRFLRASCGMAAAFVAMNNVFGNLFDVSEAEAVDVTLAAERAAALKGGETDGGTGTSASFGRLQSGADTAGLRRIGGNYSEMYMLVQLDGSALNKQQILKELREQVLRIHSIELKDAVVRVVGSSCNPDGRGPKP